MPSVADSERCGGASVSACTLVGPTSSAAACNPRKSNSRERTAKATKPRECESCDSRSRVSGQCSVSLCASAISATFRLGLLAYSRSENLQSGRACPPWRGLSVPTQYLCSSRAQRESDLQFMELTPIPDALRPGQAIVDLEHAFEQAEEDNKKE